MLHSLWNVSNFRFTAMEMEKFCNFVRADEMMACVEENKAGFFSCFSVIALKTSLNVDILDFEARSENFSRQRRARYR